MSHRLVPFEGAAAAVAVLSLAFTGAPPVCRSAGAQGWTAPRTPTGQPDLQGIWTNGTLTPLERPTEFADKAFLTEEEAAQYEARMRERNDADRRGDTAAADLATGYNAAWWDRGTRVVSTRRTSLIVDPPDGRRARECE